MSDRQRSRRKDNVVEKSIDSSTHNDLLYNFGGVDCAAYPQRLVGRYLECLLA